MAAFSILIPTYNRCEKLRVVLDALVRQERFDNGEVIVGIDGSTDGTEALLQEIKVGFPVPLSFFRIENSGRSVIRNQLLDRAKGDIILFIQDDIVVRDGWLKAHLEAHEQRRGAIVGHVTWYPGVEVTPYMHWLERGGHLLDFSSLRDGQKLDFWHFYMGNISFPKTLMGSLRFDESFRSYGWEDIVLGYEFIASGHRVFYCAGASAYHWDEYLEKDLQEYMDRVGASAVWAERKYPGVGFVPGFFKRSIFSLLITLGSVFWPVLPQRLKWYLQMKRWFLEACQREQDRFSSTPFPSVKQV